MNWCRFFRRNAADAEQRAELESYLDLTCQELIDRGMEPAPPPAPPPAANSATPP